MQTEFIQIGGAGPAGLAAAIILARAGRRVLVHEVQREVGHRFDGDFQGLENWSTQQDTFYLVERGPSPGSLDTALLEQARGLGPVPLSLRSKTTRGIIMQWLSQNWIWIVLAIGIFLLMRRGGMGHGHSHGNDGHAHQDQESNGPHADPDTRPKDPVNGEIVNPETALNSMYQGRVYYFASRENRDTFEASPAQYASRVGGHDDEHRHHRHGC